MPLTLPCTETLTSEVLVRGHALDPARSRPWKDRLRRRLLFARSSRWSPLVLLGRLRLLRLVPASIDWIVVQRVQEVRGNDERRYDWDPA